MPFLRRLAYKQARTSIVSLAYGISGLRPECHPYAIVSGERLWFIRISGYDSLHLARIYTSSMAI
uniref:Uncharacterized protein n=1 Tax=Picea glauca TaxID=3330 RepID=A0A124GNX7_PICGL|nr:hypothetical protein ABT39_MTgene24 [Picea glauca]QHR89348.1 hypothetical protein Q903MT_gene3369 [Picea sitchensis]